MVESPDRPESLRADRGECSACNLPAASGVVNAAM